MAKLPELNVPLLRKAVEWAEAEAARPEAECEWYQDTYLADGATIGRNCKTAYCIAGYVHSVIHGHEETLRKWENDEDLDSIPDEAQKLLGLTRDEAWGDGLALFKIGNSIEDVRRIATEIAAGRGEVL